MEDNRKEQIEALQVLTEFNGRLVKNMSILAVSYTHLTLPTT